MEWKDVPSRYIWYHILIFSILTIFSAFVITFATQDNIFLWLYICIPFIWIAISTFLSHYYNILLRVGRYFIFSSWIGMLIMISLVWKIINPNMIDDVLFNNAIQYATIISAFPALIFGYFISLLKTKIEPLNESEIKKNCVNFFFAGDEKTFDSAIILLINQITRNLGYDFHREQSDHSIILRRNGGSDTKYICISFDNNNLTIFPFIRDGYFTSPNPNELPLIKVICENILKFNKGNFTNKIIDDFKSFQSLNKLLRNFRKINEIRLNKKEMIFVGVFILLIFTLVLFLIKPQYQGLNIWVILPSIFAALSFIVSVIGLLKKGKKVREKK